MTHGEKVTIVPIILGHLRSMDRASNALRGLFPKSYRWITRCLQKSILKAASRILFAVTASNACPGSETAVLPLKRGNNRIQCAAETIDSHTEALLPSLIDMIASDRVLGVLPPPRALEDSASKESLYVWCTRSSTIEFVAIASAFAARLSSQKIEKEGSVQSSEARKSEIGGKKLAPVREVSSGTSSMTSSSSDESPRKKSSSPLRKAVDEEKKKVAVTVSVLPPTPQKTRRRKRGGKKNAKKVAATPKKARVIGPNKGKKDMLQSKAAERRMRRDKRERRTSSALQPVTINYNVFLSCPHSNVSATMREPPSPKVRQTPSAKLNVAAQPMGLLPNAVWETKIFFDRLLAEESKIPSASDLTSLGSILAGSARNVHWAAYGAARHYPCLCDPLVNRQRNWAAPGPDGIPFFYLKKCSSCRAKLYSFLDRFLKDPTLAPSSFFAGKTVLIPKSPSIFSANDVRPITCLNIGYKLLSTIVAFLVTEPLLSSGVIPAEQRAIRPRHQAL
ncbi:hypothetical protein HZS_128 [Henneguya salminicola]|nr:hypothetical protein HZS_128 [Henneguya salminicola]